MYHSRPSPSTRSSVNATSSSHTPRRRRQRPSGGRTEIFSATHQPHSGNYGSGGDQYDDIPPMQTLVGQQRRGATSGSYGSFSGGVSGGSSLVGGCAGGIGSVGSGVNAQTRFSPLLLESGEVHIHDWAAVATSGISRRIGLCSSALGGLVTGVATSSNSGQHCHHVGTNGTSSSSSSTSCHVPGRLRLCSRSVVFEPDDPTRGIVRIPFAKCDAPPASLSSSSSSNSSQLYGSVAIHPSRHFVMKEGNAVRPFDMIDAHVEFAFEFRYAPPQDFLTMSASLHATCRDTRVSSADAAASLSNTLRPRLSRPFDLSSLVDVRERPRTGGMRCELMTPLLSNPGCCVVTDRRIYFQPAEVNNVGPYGTRTSSWALSAVRACARRYKGLRDRAMEIFFGDERTGVGRSSVLMAFATKAEREELFQCLPEVPCHTDRAFIMSSSRKWREGTMSTYSYLLSLNSAAGRSFHDLSRYPVFPWVIVDFTSSSLKLNDPKTYRDFTKPVGALNTERLEYYRERMEGMHGMEPFLYGTHYSAPGYVLYYLVRSMPEHMLCLQNGKFDAPDRMFHSMEKTYQSVLNNHTDVKELIPEFYDTSTPPDFLINAQSLSLGNTQTGVRVHDVRLPTWSRSPRDFIRKNRQALESRHVRSNLPSWIDLIFGIHARGKEARDRHNVFYRTAYLTSRDVEEIERVEDVDAAELEAGEFGICPDVLFVKSHPFSMDSREDKDKEQETCRQNRSDNNDETDDNFVARDNDRSGLVDESDSQKMTVANMTINISSSSNNSLHSNQIASGNGSNSNNGVYNNNSCSSQWEMVAVPSDNNASRSRCSSYNSVDTSSMGSVATFSSQGSGGSGAMVGTAIVGGVFSGSGATVCVRRRAGSGVFVGEKVTGSGGTGILLSSTTTNNITAKNNSNSSKRNISHGGGGGTETSATSNNGAVNQNDNSIMGPARAWFKGIVTRSKSSVVLAPSSSSSEQPLQQQQQHDDGVMVERRDSSSLVDVDDDMNGTVLKDSNDDDDVVSIRNAGSSLSNLDPLFRKQSVGRTFSSLNQHKTASIIVQQEAGALLRFDAETDSGVETTPFSYSHVPVPPVGPAKAIPSDVVVDITLKILAWRRPHADALSSISISPYRRHHKHRTTPDDHYRRYTVASASRDGSVKMSDLSVPNTECCSSSSSQKQRRPARRKHQQPGLMLQQSHSLGTMPLSCIVLAEDGYGGNVAIVGGYDDRVTILSASPSRPQSSHESDTGTIATTAQWYLGATTTADVVHTSLTGAILASFHGHSDTVSSLHIVGCTDPLVSTHSLVTSGWDACVKVFPLDFSFDGVEVREDLVVELYDAESAVCGVGAVVIQAPSAEGEKEEEDHTGRGGSQRRRRTAISAGCDDGTIIVWLQGDTGSFEMVYKHTAETSGSPCTVIKFATPHTNDSTTYIYAAFQSGRIIQLSLCGHNVKIIGEMILESQILDMTVSSPHFIFCTCQDGSLRVLHLPAGIVSQEIPVRALRAIHGAKSPAIGAVAVVKGDGEEQENRCKDNGLCHDGFLCATGADDGSVVIFELCPKFHTLT